MAKLEIAVTDEELKILGECAEIAGKGVCDFVHDAAFRWIEQFDDLEDLKDAIEAGALDGSEKVLFGLSVKLTRPTVLVEDDEA